MERRTYKRHFEDQNYPIPKKTVGRWANVPEGRGRIVENVGGCLVY